MRGLFISNVVPWPLAAGDKIRAYHLVRAAAEVMDLTLVCFAYDEGEQNDLDALAPLVRESFLVPRATCSYWKAAQLPRARRILSTLRGHLHPSRPVLFESWESKEAEQLVQQLACRRFDVAFVEWLGGMPLLGGLEGARRFVNLNDVQYRRLKYRLTRIRPDRLTPLEGLEYLKLRRFERRLARLPYEFLVCSELDRQAIGGGPSVWVVPNGVESLPALPPPTGASNECLLLFIGEMSYAPNVDAVTFFARRVFPTIRRENPSARFFVVGRNPVDAVRALDDGSAITVTGAVPSVQPYLEKASVVVVPIRYGGGTRLKILEAMGHGRAVVSTSVGAEGIDARAEEHLLIADQPDGFAQACLRLTRDPRLRARLTAEAHRLVTTRYEWDSIERRVQAIVLRETTGGRTA
jgi:glycosyltransferase involved in cell wall biosynthesis